MSGNCTAAEEADQTADRKTAEAAGVAAIILTINQKEKTLNCLSSLRACEESQLQIFLWDNGSTDGTADAVRGTFPDVIVHHHPTNLGVASGRNAAARAAMDRQDPTYLLFLDNDMIVERGFVRALLAPFAEDKNVGQTQAKLRMMHDRDRLNDGGGCRINFVLGETKPVGFGELDRGQHDRRKRCIAGGGAMMVKAAVFRELGGFDKRFDPFGPEDIDFSLRLSKSGRHALFVPDAVAYHEGHYRFEKDYSEEYARHKARHWFEFIRRHGSTPQKLGFFLLGIPFLAIRLILREGTRGNLGAIRGSLGGMVDHIRSQWLDRNKH
jgi:GT2 family glycosyltransferase